MGEWGELMADVKDGILAVNASEKLCKLAHGDIRMKFCCPFDFCLF